MQWYIIFNQLQLLYCFMLVTYCNVFSHFFPLGFVTWVHASLSTMCLHYFRTHLVHCTRLDSLRWYTVLWFNQLFIVGTVFYSIGYLLALKHMINQSFLEGWILAKLDTVFYLKTYWVNNQFSFLIVGSCVQ